MKYVVLIHSNPRPWGHPTGDFLPEQQDLAAQERERLNREFEAGFAEVMQRGELVIAEPLASPTTARLFRWSEGQRVVTDGPYAEGKEHFAGFFLVDVESHERAEQIAALFAGPGESIELRAVMDGGGTGS